MDLQDNINKLNNVGAKREHLLNNMGVNKIMDLILYLPIAHEQSMGLIKISDIDKSRDAVFIIKAALKTPVDNIFLKGTILSKVCVQDDSADINLVWFNKPFVKAALKLGRTYLFKGKLYRNHKSISATVLINPLFEAEISNVPGAEFLPIYRLTKGLSVNIFRKLMRDCLASLKPTDMDEYLPDFILEKYKLMDITSAIKCYHFPHNAESRSLARARLVFSEFFIFLLRFRLLKAIYEKYACIVFADYDYSELVDELPFRLTVSQVEVIQESICDIRKGIVLNRLIQGDVGSGKTMVAMVLAFIAIKNGYKAIMMTPTSILAKQHYNTFTGYFDKLSIRTFLLTGKITAKQRRQIDYELSSEQPIMVVGTHSLIQDSVNIKKLGLVITDEQHRFGVAQRMKIIKKGCSPHVLVMSATPIPRTVGLILYGDMNTSIIKNKPLNRKPVHTYCITGRHRERAYSFIKKELSVGRQAYIVCPLVEGGESGIEGVVPMFYQLRHIFADYKTAILHGKMKEYEKDEVMSGFLNAEINLLIATTIIETGVDVKNASVMLIENAERFGLAQLHQLRGRIGRGEYESHCLLMIGRDSEDAVGRIKSMINTDNGFEMAEMDFKQRGGGDFFGFRQHGTPDFKIADIYKDMDILKKAKEAVGEAYEYYEEDIRRYSMIKKLLIDNELPAL